MTATTPALRALLLAALDETADSRRPADERLARVEELLLRALAEEAALPTGEAARIASLPGVAAAITRVRREGRNGMYFEANEDGSPSDRLMRVP